MTKVFQILEEEKQEAVLQAKKEATEKANRQTAMRMIHRNMEEALIMEISGLSKGEVEKLRKDMAVNS